MQELHRLKPDEQTMPDEALIEKQAVAWFTRMNGAPSASDKQDFAQWLAASSAHARSYRKLEALWSDLGPLADVLGSREAARLAGPLEKIDELRRKRRIGKIGAGIALSLAMLLAGGWIWLEQPHLLQDLHADYVTARGEQRNVTLADGSTILLDADTALAVELSPARRRVRLLRGTVFFEVRPSQAPFVVEAHNGEASVLGTAFEVAARRDDEVTVTLDHGSVRVGLLDRSQDVVLKPGESVEYGAAGLGPTQAVDLGEATAWRMGRFIFTNARLADVLQQIGRYRDGRIVLLGSGLGDRRVSGNIALRDTDAALAAVQSSVGLRITRLGRLTMIGP
jgi:transmembrane sensor